MQAGDLSADRGTIEAGQRADLILLRHRDERLLAWEAVNAEQLDRARSVFEEVNSLGQDDMASLSVALRLLRSIVRR